MDEEVLKESEVPVSVDAQRPFMGLHSYEEKDVLQFGGRDEEIKELFNLVDQSRLTIIFGKSGIGKTSLIKAGLIPELNKNFYYPVYVRIDYSSDKAPLDQLKESIYSKLKELEKDLPQIANRTLWEYFHDMKLLNGLVVPALIIDQFEEIFTIGVNNAIVIEELIIELSDLAENRVPLIVQKKYQARSEIISSHYGAQPYSIILSLREDYLAQLESLKKYSPSIRNSRFRVIRMTVEQAMDAVTKPAKGLVEKHVAAEIIKKLPGISNHDFDVWAEKENDAKRFVVEPFLLSLICYQINEKRIEVGLDKISLKLVSEFDIADVINSFYNNTMEGYTENVQRGIEDTLLTETGFRKLESVSELISKYSITSNDIQQLIDKRIIRKELRNEVEYIELIHDVLTPVIKQKRDKRTIELHEKEKAEAIKRGVALYRTKRRRIIRTVLLVSSPIIVMIGISYYKSTINAKRYENLAFAQKLLLTSESLSRNSMDDSTAALISRVAFLINTDNKGENDNGFYNSMYGRLYDMKYNFNPIYFDSTQIRAIATLANGIFYIGCQNGRVFKLTLKDSTNNIDTFYRFPDKVTSLSISPSKKYIAVAGIFDSVYIFNLVKNLCDTVLFSGDSIGNSKSVCFSGDDRLILRLDSGIICWKIISFNRLTWAKRAEFIWNGNKRINAVNIVSWNKNYLESQSMKVFHCIASFRNEIALGSDSAVFLIKEDTLLEIKSTELGITRSIAFDAQGRYLYIGNNLGNLCRMSLNDYTTEFNQCQSTYITNIACRNDGNYVASASFDGSVVIFDTKKDFSSSSILHLTQYQQNNYNNVFPYGVAFSEDNSYLFACYSDGSIWKWPVSSEILADLICQTDPVKQLNDSIWNKYLGNKVSIEQIGKYICNDKTTNK